MMNARGFAVSLKAVGGELATIAGLKNLHSVTREILYLKLASVVSSVTVFSGHLPRPLAGNRRRVHST